jgi:hypothetical protein
MFWPQIFLGAIAAATIIMAVMQMGALIVVGRMGRRVERLAAQVDEEIKPLLASLQSMSQDAARTVSLAVAQVERADRLFADVSQRVEQTVADVQGAIVEPVREGVALVAALRAAIAALREGTRRPGRAEDEDPLFIG